MAQRSFGTIVFEKLMPQKITLVTFSWLFFASAANASLDIETAKATIIETLQRENPSVIGEFKRLCRRYDRIIITFFDTNNTDSLKTHINYMEAELRTLKNLCDDIRFRSVQSILTNFYEHIQHLITILQQYIGSRNTISLALKVRNYKFLLPKIVHARGDLALLKGLNHRLRC